ncbi:MAG: hypothetical protein EBU80_05530 [Chitinophagia bacterium]|nr:hypothetical protein [Chitinophagia bacterium]
MKKILFSVLCLTAVLIAGAQNLTKVKDALVAKKYTDANTQLDEFINNPKYQKNAELYYLKAKMYSEIATDTNLAKTYPNVIENSLENFKKAYTTDNTKFTTFVTLEGAQPVYNLYAIPYNRGVKELDAKEYDKSLKSLQLADAAGRFIFERGLGLAAIDTNLVFYTGYAALLAGKEDLSAEYFNKLAAININEKGFQDVYKNLMIYYFNKSNIAEFEKVRAQGGKLYPTEEYFTYDEVMFINDMKDKEQRFKKIEAKVASDPKNLDAMSILAEILFERLFYAESPFYKTDAEYDAAEARLVDLYNKMAEVSPEDGLMPFNAGLVYVNKGFELNNKVSDINDKIKKFNESQKPDKTGKIPPPPKELTSQRDDIRAKQVVAYDKGLPYLLKAQPMLEKKATDKSGAQAYKKLVNILIDLYSSKRQLSKVPADKAKFEAEEAKWNKEYDRLSNIH